MIRYFNDIIKKFYNIWELTIDIDNGIVYLQMQGACSGCPSSTATLKMGIENMLKHYVPEVKEVRSTDA